MELKQIELKVREREKMIIDHEANVQLLETEHKLKLEMLYINSRSASEGSKSMIGIKSPKLPAFDEAKDEMDSYLSVLNDMVRYMVGLKISGQHT